MALKQIKLTYAMVGAHGCVGHPPWGRSAVCGAQALEEVVATDVTEARTIHGESPAGKAYEWNEGGPNEEAEACVSEDV